MLIKRLSKLMLTVALLATPVAKAACEDCTTLDFNKKIELKLIAPMLQMTVAEKAKYIQSFGVELFKVADPDGKPATLAFLPEAPQDKFSKYIKLFQEKVLGIYMTNNSYMYGVNKPTILYIESADDWTMIHEFAHYLFDKARIMEDSTRESSLLNHSEDAQEDYFDARDVYKNLDMYVSEEHKTRTINSFIAYATVQMIFARTCEFEESTIEKLIRAIYAHDQPHGFNQEHFDRSTRYIRSTSTTGQQNLGFLSTDCVLLNKTLDAKDAELKKALAKTCAQVEKLNIEDLNLLKGLKLELNPQP